MSITKGSGIVSNRGGEERLVGRIAARLHAAHIAQPLNAQEAHSAWLCLKQEQRTYWERLAREVVMHFNDDNRWAI